MSGFDGNGTFVLPYNWQTDKANGIKIRADRMDGQDQSIADGLSQVVTRDGQSPATANLPMGGFKHTNVAAASSRTDYARASQLQDNDLTYFTAAGTIDAYTLTPAPAITARTPGLGFYVRIPTGKTSTSATPTLDVSGVFTATICNADGSQLAAGDLAADGVYHMVDQGTVGMCLVNKAAANPFGLTNAGYYATSFEATVTNAVYTVYPPTAGMYVGLNNSSVSAGKFQMFVYVGPYPLYMYGTINGVSGTIAILQRQNFTLACTTTDGWV